MKKTMGIILALSTSLILAISASVFADEAEPADRVITDNPAGIAGDAYGYEGPFNPDIATETVLTISTGEYLLDHMQVIGWESPVIQNSGDSVLTVRDSYIRGETLEETVPLAGAPGSLLIAGNMRTTLAMQNGQSYYINSTIISRNWAVLSTDAAKPVQKEGELPQALYAYGSEAIAMDGGYGAYSDMFCSIYIIGSHLRSPETGIISGSYGAVFLGNIADGENMAQLQSVLSEEDRAKQPDKGLDTIVEAGRNALMIHSINLPAYWHYDGYSKEEVPLMSAEIYAHDSILKTDLSLEKKIGYSEQQQAYIDHTKGSVILVKSTNVQMLLDNCELIPDENGTGYLLQTVYSNDTLYMIAVPDGQSCPGVHVTMKDMKAAGDIAHEDYQRELYLQLDNVNYEGSMNQYSLEHWREAAQKEGFTDYCLDDSYETCHGLYVSLTGNTVWNVTGDSHLTDLQYEPGCMINGSIYLNGVLQTGDERSYHGDVVVKPF